MYFWDLLEYCVDHTFLGFINGFYGVIVFVVDGYWAFYFVEFGVGCFVLGVDVGF